MLVSKLGADWMYTEDGTKAAIDTDDVKDVTEKYLDRVEKGVEPSYVDVTTQRWNRQICFLQEKLPWYMEIGAYEMSRI